MSLVRVQPSCAFFLGIIMDQWENRTLEYTSETKEVQESKKIIELYSENMELRAIIKYLEHKLLINNKIEDLFKNPEQVKSINE